MARRDGRVKCSCLMRAHLEAFAVLFRAVGFFAVASLHVLVDNLPGSCFHALYDTLRKCLHLLTFTTCPKPCQRPPLKSSNLLFASILQHSSS